MYVIFRFFYGNEQKKNSCYITRILKATLTPNNITAQSAQYYLE